MKNFLLMTLVFLCVLPDLSEARGKRRVDENRLKGVEAELNALLKATHASGFAVAVVEKDSIIFAKGFGYSDYENRIPVNENTLFAIGSSTKAFTSALLGLLADEGKLSLNDAPSKHVMGFSFYNNEMNNQIVIRDLMCHRTGLPRHDFSWYFFPTTNKDSLLQRVKYHEPFAGVREKWHYNNYMFLAQGVIAEHITGKSWEQNIRERFFKPLGMERSSLTIGELKSGSNVAKGYNVKSDSVISLMDYYDISGMSPAGAINSSVKEMSNWMITWINKGKFKGKQLIPASYVDEAISSHMVAVAALPAKDMPESHISNYGYGWFISSYKGHYRVEHGGNIDGFSANVALFPSDSIGIVVLVNQNGSALPALVRNLISDRVLKCSSTDWLKRYKDRIEERKSRENKAKAEFKDNRVKGTKPSHSLQEFTGIYSNPGYGEFVIENINDSLIARFKVHKLYLKHYHFDIFEPFQIIKGAVDTSDGSGGIKFNFIAGESGEISYVKVNMEPSLNHPIEFKRRAVSIDLDKNTLESYAGDFDLMGVTIKLYTKKDGKLYLFIQGQPEYELIATSKNKFSFKILDGYKLDFKDDQSGIPNKVDIIQPNGTFTAVRKK